jgi:uncharacterized protein (DUF885 family)
LELDRRSFVVSASAAAIATAFLPDSLRAQARGGPGDAALNALFERIFQAEVLNSPELASSLGLDKGANAALKRRLSPRTAEERQRELARTRRALAQLATVDRTTLSPAARLNLEVVTYSLTAQTTAPSRFGLDSAIRPYRIFQQGGAYFSVPDFLNTAHTIVTREDCEAYLARLAGFADALDQDSAMQKAEAARGYLAPRWSLDLTWGQLE